jgi:hypothetical protein
VPVGVTVDVGDAEGVTVADGDSLELGPGVGDEFTHAVRIAANRSAANTGEPRLIIP